MKGYGSLKQSKELLQKGLYACRKISINVAKHVIKTAAKEKKLLNAYAMRAMEESDAALCDWINSQMCAFFFLESWIFYKDIASGWLVCVTSVLPLALVPIKTGLILQILLKVHRCAGICQITTRSFTWRRAS